MSTGSRLALIAAGVCLGLAFQASFRRSILFPVLRRSPASCTRRRGAAWRVEDLLLLLPVGLLILNAGYLFQGSTSLLGSLGLGSDLFRHVSAFLRLPLPSEWLRGLDEQISSYAAPLPAYFLGRLFDDGGTLGDHDVAAFLLKTSLPVLILAALGVAAASKHRREVLPWLLAPILLQLLLISVVVHQKIGVRYVLPVYPFLFLVAGGATRLIRADVPGRRRCSARCWSSTASARSRRFRTTSPTSTS